ncbi:AraC family transcriptional regulator [Verrucomicrobiaceae bacterium N1E253]|uniref:AraC family transcriptional regulator n=1 Tax=Oceaniferula marina TaxID=2748318 RepID=A0A851GMC1_9BACT|nr:AraC family transcriptional regulator [Oceaniferula marina]NWK55274.1 AraC family transcriptional regulator [Oceaniferula marina]
MKNQPFTSELMVTDIGYYPCAEAHFVERMDGLNGHILVFCLDGRGWFSWGGERMEVAPMEVFWVPARQAHSYGSFRDGGWEIYWVHVEGEDVEPLLGWTPLSRDQPLISFTNAHALRRQFNMMLQSLESGFSDHVLFQLSRFMITLVGLLHVDAGSSRAAERRERMELAIEQMRSSVSEPLALEAYARTSGFAVSQFSSLFKQYYGSSPMAYLAELRVQRACELFDTTGMSVKEVAFALGFEDPLYFSRMFKKVAGVAPSAYRLEQS